MLRIGIIGAGHFAERHLTALQRLGSRARVTHVARRNPHAPFPEAEAAGARIVDLDSLLGSDEVDAVCVCSPNGLHRAHAEAALAAGKHVLCEKPLALSAADVDAVISAAERAGRVLVVAHLTRYAPIYITAVRILARGDIGRPACAYSSRFQVRMPESWRMDPAQGGGAPFDLLIHDFDLLNWALGEPGAIIARGRQHPQGAYEYLSAALTFASGACAIVEGGFILPDCGRFRSTVRIIGDGGVLEIDSAEEQNPIRVCQQGGAERRLPAEVSGAAPEGIPGEWNEFLNTVEGAQSARRLTLDDARRAVRCAELAVQSAIEGCEMAFG